MIPLNIKTNGIQTEYPSPLPKFRKAPKSLSLITYTLSQKVIQELNELVVKGTHIRCCAAKVEGRLHTAKFPILIRQQCHAKIWLIDKKVYIGSANLTADTIFNVMFEVTCKKKKDVIQLVDDIFNLSQRKWRNIII